MTRHHRLTAAALFVSLSLAGASALAAKNISVGASISNASMTVIDLTPNDGMSASYRFDGAGSSYVEANLTAPATSWSGSTHDKDDIVLALGATLAHGSSSVASTSTGVGEVRIETRLQNTAGTGARANGYIAQMVPVWLAPHTKLIYSGYGEMAISDATQYGPNNFRANSHLNINFGYQPFTRGINQGWAGLNDSGVRGEAFSLEFSNDQDTAISIYLSMELSNYASYDGPSPSAVPEPAAFAMFGFGALIVGAAARRRRRVSSAAA
ncbi:PEP-CTERM sorting domain-containing protein [Massilia rubra]|uniref:PEP-CTERM sorting domain-containing protein n=1 Tax=Massilia rubra TaxID=2607910 RepID=A0ABX0LI57_9BURK|nr:PEP-CTERM sorting domain-containing protein [Massilia rubra]NHZ34364.1 PEP-CTERM sorting domain-containing protein [Massilia rubra]